MGKAEMFFRSFKLFHGLVIYHQFCLELFILISTKQQQCHISCCSSFCLKHVKLLFCCFYAPFWGNAQDRSLIAIKTDGMTLFG